MQPFATVVVVDPRGWILLQERDEHAPIDPDRWGLVGGHLEDGEDFETAVRRELVEEIGQAAAAAVGGHLERWREFAVRHDPHDDHDDQDDQDRMVVYAAGCRLTDADIEVGEGRQIVFVAPEQARALPLSTAAADALPAFLASAAYRRARTAAGAGAAR